MTDGQDIKSAPPKEAGRTETEPTAPSEESGEASKPNKRRWRERRSVHALRREALKDHAAWADWDQRDNGETRLPDGEEVHLAGLVLAEAFTPSTVPALRKGLEDFPGSRDKAKEEWLALLTKSRSAAGAGGWASLGVVRRIGDAFALLGSVDPALPDGIEAVWPYLFFPTPSLTVIVATFTLTDQAGDLSDLLRADYRANATDFRLQVYGRFGRLRAHIPWARPRSHGGSWTLRRAEDQKRLACESLITRREADCWIWLADRFPGRFSAEKSSDRPAARLLLTKESVPYSDSGRWLAPAGLSFGPGIWQSTDPAGWFLKFGDWPRDRRFTITAAARSRDAARGHGGGESGDTIWYLTQDFAVDQSALVARWAMTCLLSLYTDRLAELRDRAGTRRRVSRPVRQGRDLDRYLIGDGLDASTVVSDLEGFTRHLSRFRRHVPEYSEYLDGYPEPLQSGQPAELIPSMREQLQAQAETLGRDTAATTVNIRASAELRQSMANTRLQRVILCLTVLAITVAIISLVVALHANR